MSNDFNLEKYLTDGVEAIVKRAIRATFQDPKESIFIGKYAIASKRAASLRRKGRERGENIPPFLIASITTNCNLHCSGCYARSNQCEDKGVHNQLTAEEWRKIFEEAQNLGISFILLAGGEPMLRKEVIVEAGKIPNIIFPVFTNGTMVDDASMMLFDKHRNLIPVFSMEGHKDITDGRRGVGVYHQVMLALERMKKEKLLFGVSITVTKENIWEVTSEEFISHMSESGVKLIFYIEYVPVTKESIPLAPEEEDRKFLNNQLESLRNNYEDIIFISFPGDEKSSGGCLAAGRGFFHINSQGGAEPCPFSPYSDINVKDRSLKEALQSEFFQKLQNENILMEEHSGGCVLFERREKVQELLNKKDIF